MAAGVPVGMGGEAVILFALPTEPAHEFRRVQRVQLKTYGVKKRIQKSAHEYNGEDSQEETNKTIIFFIPKVLKPSSLSQFRSISLCNVVCIQGTSKPAKEDSP
jgi:hypothetical protein